VLSLGGESLKVTLVEGILKMLTSCNTAPGLPCFKALKSTWWKTRNAHTPSGERSFLKCGIEQYLKVKGRRRGTDNCSNLVENVKNREAENE